MGRSKSRARKPNRPAPGKKAARKKVRLAFIGAGSMANAVHYPSVASFDDVEIAAICDLNAERLRETADRYGVDRRYTSYPQMIDEVAPDAVYAIGQPHLMYGIWVWCLTRGLNLYIEKPMGLTLHQARNLAHLAEEHGCITQVSFQRRACPLLVEMHRRCLEHGPIGHAVCSFYKWAPAPFLGPVDHMMDDTVHAIDTLRWACGGEVVEVQSQTRRVGVPDTNFIAALLRFDSGATGVLLNSWTSGRRLFKVELHAPGIFADVELEGRAVLYAGGDTAGAVYESREVAGSAENFVFGGFRAKNREFIDALRGGARPSSHFGDAFKTMEVAARILAQSLLRED